MHFFAILSGLFASLGSLFGKISGIPALEGLWIVRIFCVALMLLCNGCVWTNYVKALHQSGSTIAATVVSTATNYVFSAMSGMLIFGEATSLIWWTGIVFIVFGLVLIVQDDKEDIARQKVK